MVRNYNTGRVGGPAECQFKEAAAKRKPDRAQPQKKAAYLLGRPRGAQAR